MTKKNEVGHMVTRLWTSIGIDTPSNHDTIVQYCFDDIEETADPINWHSGDVTVAFRRWIEAQTQE